MKKILLTTISAILLSGCAMCADSKLDILTLFSSKSKSSNKAWVGTFQLVFNDMKNNIIKKNIEFVNEKPNKELIGLNNEEFNSSMLLPSSYYASYGETSPEEKIKIEKGIMEKFGEKSDILDTLDWSKGIGKYYAYAMLKKKFEFYNEFDKLEKQTFNNKGEYNFFGINDDSDEVLNNNIRVLFYNNKNDYAVQLLTKSNDIVYLYRTNNNSSFDKLYEKMVQKSEKYDGNRNFTENDTIKVPDLKINDLRKYPQLLNKQIKGTEIYFSEAIETLQLELNNKGGEVKSEAAIMAKTCSIELADKKDKPRHFNFDKTFAMFLVDAGKEYPYLALRIKDLKEFQK